MTTIPLPSPLANVILDVTIVVAFVGLLVPLLMKLSGLVADLLVKVINDVAKVREAYRTKLKSALGRLKQSSV